MRNAFAPAVGIGYSVIAPAGVTRPNLSKLDSTNQRFPSGPAVMPSGRLSNVGIVNTVTTPAVVMRPMAVAEKSRSANHRPPSGPVVIPSGSLPDATGNSVMTPAVVMRPILPAERLDSVNHSAPSGPAVISDGELAAVGIWNSVMAPAVVLRPILFAVFS